MKLVFVPLALIVAAGAAHACEGAMKPTDARAAVDEAVATAPAKPAAMSVARQAQTTPLVKKATDRTATAAADRRPSGS
jgi:hypothetical protein